MPRITPTPLCDHDAEAAVLSAVILDNSRFDSVQHLGCCVFHDSRHARVWDEVRALIEDGGPADIVTICHALRSANRLNEVGGTPWLAELLESTPSIANIEWHAAIVHDLYLSRVAASAMETAAHDIRNGDPWRAAVGAARESIRLALATQRTQQAHIERELQVPSHDDEAVESA